MPWSLCNQCEKQANFKAASKKQANFKGASEKQADFKAASEKLFYSKDTNIFEELYVWKRRLLEYPVR